MQVSYYVKMYCEHVWINHTTKYPTANIILEYYRILFYDTDDVGYLYL